MSEAEWTWRQLSGFQLRFSRDPGMVLQHADHRVLKSQHSCRAPPQASFPDCANAKDRLASLLRVQSQATLRLFPPPEREDPINVES